MKEKYFRPTVINAETLEGTGLIPIAVAGVTIKAAAALLAGYVAGRAVTKSMNARPAFKLPSLTKGGYVENDLSMA